MRRTPRATPEELRREEEQDDRNYRNVKEGGCCLLELLSIGAVSSLCLVFLFAR